MAFASAISGRAPDPGCRPKNPDKMSLVQKLLSRAGVRAFQERQARLRPTSESRGISTRDAALNKALERASGTWGGYQASRPFNYRLQD